MRYQTAIVAKFGDCDPAGIVYYPRFFEWFHDTFEDVFGAVAGTPYARILMDLRVGFPAVQIAAEFLRPVRFGDHVQLEVFLSRISDRSATFEYRVRGTELLATASIKVASMHMDEKRSVPIPASIRAALERYVEFDAERADLTRLR